MLKNKIYKYLSSEIFKNFITILLTFAAIAWVVRAVNFLDLIVEDGHSLNTYLKYSALNITTIITRFVPLAFLLSLTVSIIKFENQQELLILWTSGLSKIKIANFFLFTAFVLTLFQLILSLFVNPFLLNKARFLMSNTESLQINSVIKSKEFNDNFKGITFYIDSKNTNNELLNIFIKDVSGNISTIAVDEAGKINTIIIAEKGFIDGDKLILFNGTVQVLNENNEFKNFQFKKNELSLANISTRTIVQTKIQETSSGLLTNCLFNQNNNLTPTKCLDPKYKSEVVQNLSRRMGTPLYITLITTIVSFLLLHKKEKKYNFLKKYILFILSFMVLIAAEILLKYTGSSLLVVISYYVLPIVLSFLLYIYLLKKILTEKISQ